MTGPRPNRPDRSLLRPRFGAVLLRSLAPLVSPALLCALTALVLFTAGCGSTGEDSGSTSTEEVQPSGSLGESGSESEATDTTHRETSSRSGESSSSSERTPGTTVSESSSSSSSEPEPELRTCRVNLDCFGGELCEGGVCRAVCAPDIACENEALPHCDEEAGFCVRCIEDEQCPEGRRCTGERSCARACEEDATCGEGRVCETDRGYCVSRQCEENTDCAGGFYCAGGRCIDLEERVCVPESGSCEENELTACNRYGTNEVLEACGDEALCVEEDGRAACLPIVCDADTQRCTDGGALALCNDKGTDESLVDCASHEICDQNRCRAIVCEAGTITCEGNSVRVCNATGTSAVLDPCNERGNCQASPFGCTCEVGECVERVCEPDRARCEDDNPVRCSADGLDEVPLLACDSDQICFGGECLDAECAPGEMRCAGDVLLACEIGNFVEERDCAAEERFCQTSLGISFCQERVCEPGEQTCVDGALEICDSRGAAVTTQGCPQGTYCEDGTCRDQICEPETLFCANSSQVARCNDEGSDSTLTQICRVMEEMCEDGACVCQPGRTLCGDRCANFLTSGAHCGGCNQPCGERQFCQEGECACLNDFTLCDGRCVNTQTDPQACGSCTRSCSDDERCVEGQCVDQPCSCLPAEMYCMPTDCGSSINGHEYGCCSTGEVCDPPPLFGLLPCLEFDPNYTPPGSGSSP